MAHESYEVANDCSNISDDVVKSDGELDIYVDEIPMALCMVNSFSKQYSSKPFVVLLDTGSSHTWWNVKSLPKGCVPRKVAASSSTTLAGNMSSNLEVDLEDLTFPEFFKTRRIGKQIARAFTADCRYDAIIGRDLLHEIGLKICFKTKTMEWDDCRVPMKVFANQSKNSYGLKEPSVAEMLYMDMLEADLEDDDTYVGKGHFDQPRS